MKQQVYLLLTVSLFIGATAKLPNNVTDCTTSELPYVD